MCTVPDGPFINEGDLLLGTAPLGQILHYDCAVAKRKDLLKAIFAEQEEERGHPDQAGREALYRVEATVSFAELAPDSDDDLLDETDS